MDIPSFLRPLGIAAGPVTVVALGLVLAAAGTAGADIESSPLAIAASTLLLVALLGIGATAFAMLARARETGRGAAAPALAVVGTVLVAGGAWAALFVLPALAAEAPDVLESGALGSVMVGYVASYAVFALGWVATGITVIRARTVPTWLGVLVVAGGAASMVPAPEPFRLLIISVAASLVAQRLTVASPKRTPSTSLPVRLQQRHQL
jgi:uncharacterized membrane protein (DUF485 family)